MQYDYNKLFLLMKLIKFFFKGLENVQINYILSEKYHNTRLSAGLERLESLHFWTRAVRGGLV